MYIYLLCTCTLINIMCIRVSQRMLGYSSLTNEELSTVKLLLENCIKLLHCDPGHKVIKALVNCYYYQ